MPVLMIPLEPAGAFLPIELSVSRASTGPANRPKTWRALLDTESNMTAVSPAVVSVGRAGGGSVRHDTYDVRIRFGDLQGPGRWFAIEAVAVQPATPDVDVLIGMDLLLKLHMIWDGPVRQVVLTC